MGRLLSGLGAVIAYLCVGTMLAMLIIVGYAASKGFVDKQKLTDMLAVARGAHLSSGGESSDSGKKPAQMMSVEEMDQRRTTLTRHLELREQAVQNALQQIEAERDKLRKEREVFDQLVTAFRKEKETTQSRDLAKGLEDARAILENVKPKIAKDYILRMIAADQKDDVVAILSAMPIGKQKKIIEEFKEEDEKRKFYGILQLIQQGTGEAKSASATNESTPPPPEPRQP